ncbi:hypothetical protein [Pseudomonas sp. PONIH3]|uniref:hypothetical protein n=1 Tax=Pseudomonas sp. PONIH3 TaxID=1636610 RepID=UPI003D2BAAFD
MLEVILLAFFITASPVILLMSKTRAEPLKHVYIGLYYVKFVPLLLSLYAINLSASFLAWKWVQLKWLLPRYFGYRHYNRDSISMESTAIPGTDYHMGYIPKKLPAELVYRWRKDKVYHNYIQSIIKANRDYYKVPLGQFPQPTAISDEDLKVFLMSSQITHYLQTVDGVSTFDMRDFTREIRLSSSVFDVASISIAQDFATDSMRITLRDGFSVGPGEPHWDLAKVYFMSNTMVFFILGAHLHHHLFFAEMGAAFLFNLVPKGSNFHKLMDPHTAYILMLNHQFKESPLSLRETTGIADKFLYSCIGYYSAQTFYKVGYENALNMYNKRDTEDQALTQKFEIKFAIPFDQYLNGQHALNAQYRDYYAAVLKFVTASYDDLLRDGSEPYINNWVAELCRYVNLPCQANDKAFNIEVIATYIWYVSFVHSLEHYQFHKYKMNYCLLTRLPFAVAKHLPAEQVFSQYDIWKSKHIVHTFGKNHLNAGVSESYADLDYKFRDLPLIDKQAQLKKDVLALLEKHQTPNDAIALSIRY